MTSPATGDLSAPVAGLPPHYLPRVAAYARGPFIEPRLVTPSEWSWRNARAYIVTDYAGQEWRCLRVTAPGGHHYGWWAVELLGLSLMGDTGQPPDLTTPGLLIQREDGVIVRLPNGWREMEGETVL